MTELKKAVCDRCLTLYSVQSPIFVCNCGNINYATGIAPEKFVVDFTIKRHGQISIRGIDSRDAKKKFENWTKNNQDVWKYLEDYIFDSDIEANFAYGESLINYD
jgi:hypothetical protein